MKLKISCRPQQSLWLKKIISKGLIIGLLLNSGLPSFAGSLSEDGRYETFEGNNITIDNVLEEQNVDISIEGNTLVNLGIKKSNVTSTRSNVTIENGIVTGVSQAEEDAGFYFEPTPESINMIKGKDVTIFLYGLHASNTSSVRVYNRTKSILYSNIISINDVKKDLVFKVTIPGDIKDTDDLEIIIMNPLGLNSWTKVEDKLMILEGDWTNKEIPEYFEGMKSVGENNSIKLSSIGSNLLNINDYYIASSIKHDISTNDNIVTIKPDLNKDVSYTQFRINPSITLKANKKYRVTGNIQLENVLNNRAQFLVVSPNNATFINENIYLLNGDFSHTFTVKHDVNQRYIDNKGWLHDLAFEIVLEKIDSSKQMIATISNLSVIEMKDDLSNYNNYLPFELDNKEILLKEPLRGLPNGVKDRIIKRNGQWVIERNCGEIILDGSEYWVSKEVPESNIVGTMLKMQGLIKYDTTHTNIVSNRFKNSNRSTIYEEKIYFDGYSLTILIDSAKVSPQNYRGIQKWLSENPTNVVYQLETPIYEPLNISPTINLYLDTTHISNNSTIPANMKVIVDRAINRATEAIELAQENPTVDNISKARMWINLLKESTNKDELNNQVNDITEIKDLTINKKTTTSNVDVYIKSQNGLSMSLSTNSIIFDDFDSTEDMEKLNAVDVTVDSSLPYRLNSYLMSEIKNEGGTNIIPKELFNIKINGENDYKAFSRLNEKLVLKEDCSKGESRYGIDLILKGSLTHESDVYKTTIKFEAEQK